MKIVFLTPRALGKWLAAIAIGACAGLTMTGCASGAARSDASGLRETGRDLFGDAGNQGGDAGGGGQRGSGADGVEGDSGWSVVIANFPNTEEGRTRAQHALRQVRTRGELPEAHLERRRERIVLAVGQFESPRDPEAKRELERVRALEVEDVRPYRTAVLGPPAPQRVYGSIPKYDLRNAREIHGPDAMYTLQIGVYGRTDRTATPTPEELREYRRTAERAVVELREQGETAFYYHGPARSTVTVGVFGPEDHDPYAGLGAESQRLKEARQRHPHNLLNGQGIRERLPGRPGTSERDFRLQPSRLVKIPE